MPSEAVGGCSTLGCFNSKNDAFFEVVNEVKSYFELAPSLEFAPSLELAPNLEIAPGLELAPGL